MLLSFILKVSRPRFWLYVFGPYIVGAVAGAADRSFVWDWHIPLFAIYFLLPANLLIYGTNDIFDFETDRLNEKKQGYETLVQDDRRGVLLILILVLNVPFFLAAVFVTNAFVPLAVFIFLSVFYSAPPVRAKSVPFLDSAFNVLYVFPAVLSYRMVSGTYPDTLPIIAAGLWTAAMHAYSAVPDIEADKAAGVSTIATFLGSRTTLILCGVVYAAAAMIAFKYLGLLAPILGAVYLLAVGLSLAQKSAERLFSIYRYFPLLNALGGFLIFWYIAIHKWFL